MIVSLTDATFDELVLRAARPVLVDYTAEWCPPCRMLEPVLEAIATEQADRLTVAQLDVDAHPLATRAAGVLSMPTLILYIDGAPVAQAVGARPKAALMRMLEPHLPVRVEERAEELGPTARRPGGALAALDAPTDTTPVSAAASALR